MLRCAHLRRHPRPIHLADTEPQDYLGHDCLLSVVPLEDWTATQCRDVAGSDLNLLPMLPAEHPS